MKPGLKMRLIIDTNIFVSGLLNREGAPGKILDSVLYGDLIAVMSDTTFNELSEVLNRPRLAPYFKKANAKPVELAATPPKPDFLITGDKDFEEKRYAGVKVISANQFTKQFLSF
jgi:predicted nucleic acid-binding protein